MKSASAAAWADTSPWPQVVGLATHSRQFLSSLLSPFTMLKLFRFSFSPIYLPHTYTLQWFPVQEGYMAGEPLGDILCPYCVVWGQAGL